MKCSVCRADADARRRWGCDEDSEQTGLEFECWGCADRIGPELEVCATCGGAGVVRLRRCPNAILDREAVDVVKAAARVQLGILPVAGGWCDQAALFCEAADLVAHHSARYHEQRLEAMRKGQT